jgi:hypothetical protein
MPPKLPRDQICFEGSYHEPTAGLMAGWLAQMKAGYKAGHPLSSFEAQLQIYVNKIAQAEATLRAMVSDGRGPES